MNNFEDATDSSILSIEQKYQGNKPLPFFLALLLLCIVFMLLQVILLIWLIIRPLNYLFLFFIYYPFERLFRAKLDYTNEGQIFSLATEIFFTRSKYTHQRICLKRWQPWKDELYDTQDVDMCTRYLLEGLKFNRKFARGIYLGIAEVEVQGKYTVQRGRLIFFPKFEKLKRGVPYVLVMKRLKESWKLDSQLQDSLGTVCGMEFLAREVAKMHTHLEPSFSKEAQIDVVKSKMHLNRELFYRALKQLSLSEEQLKVYHEISLLLERFVTEYKLLFTRRHDEGHTKRCHGDLKVANLWVRPTNVLLLRKKKLLALDCVDFRPEFCHIDTLSDVAMLAVDLEMHLTYKYKSLEEDGHTLAQDFLISYLKAYNADTKEARLLLEYYMIEKAVIFACMSILYDKQPEVGEKYLTIANVHVEYLQKLSPILQQQSCLQEPDVAVLEKSTVDLPV